MKINILKKFWAVFIAFIWVVSNGQESKIVNVLEGYWEGAFIKNNSSQTFKVQFLKGQNQFQSLQVIEEWHPQFGEFLIPTTIDSLGKVNFSTGYGKAKMTLDIKNLELVGEIEESIPSIYVHLKKVPKPPKPNYKVEAIEIASGTNTLFGHLHQPTSKSNTALILVGGRGCYAGNTKYDLYAKLLRAYGISVLVFNKRGTGKSSGNCNKATITDLANDVVACREFLKKHPNQYNNIGVLGSSAGGWVITKAEEKTDFDFMISIVGPSTSVREQQLQSMDYGFDFYNLPDSTKPDLVEYTNMMFDAPANKASYDRFQELLASSKTNGWYDLLDDTDIPRNVDDINNLWVRRHAYNPNQSLKGFNKPFLAIYGEIDWIVPYKENVERLESSFNNRKEDILNIIIANDAEHGTETKGKYISLDGQQSYWRFYRIAPSVQIGIIDFLIKYDFIEYYED